MKRAAGPVVAVNELNLRKTSLRILGQILVSTEIDYIQRTLGASATQQEMDATVLAVRRMPWASIVAAE